PTLFFSRIHSDLPALHSFPPRRSSDLFAEASGLHLLCQRLEPQHPIAFLFLDQRRIHLEHVRHSEGECAADRGTRTLSGVEAQGDRKSTRLNSSHVAISYAVFCLKKKK